MTEKRPRCVMCGAVARKLYRKLGRSQMVSIKSPAWCRVCEQGFFPAPRKAIE